MLARVLRLKLKADATKGFARTAEDEIVPAMKKFAAFAG